MTATVDANVLLYASDRSSGYHERALAILRRLAEGADPLYLFWPIVMAYLRIATHPAVFDHPLSFEAAAENIEHLLDRPHVRTPSEEESFWRTFRDVTAETPTRGNLVPDAHVVALMRRFGVRTIVSHDRDYRKFDGIRVLDPFA